MDFATFVAATASAPPPGHRFGQYVFNLLYAVRPDLSERIRATDIDPYYDDDAVAPLTEWLSANWPDVGAVRGVDAVQG